MKGTHLRFRQPLLALALCSAVAAAGAGSELTDIARRIDSNASQLLEDSSASSQPFTPGASRYLESLDEFVGAAHELATGTHGYRDESPALRRLDVLGSQVSAAIMMANVSPDIVRQWEATRALLDQLRASRQAVRVEPVSKRQPSVEPLAGDGLPAAELNRTSQQLLAAVRSLPPAGGNQRLLLLGKAQKLSEACAAVERAAAAGDLSGPQVESALNRAIFYSERMEQSIGESDSLEPIRPSHEAFMATLDRLQQAMHAAVVRDETPAVSRSKPKPKKAKKLKKAVQPKTVVQPKAQQAR